MASPSIFLNGTDQKFVFELSTAAPADDPIYRGTTDGEALTNCQIKYRYLGGAWSTVTSPTITWDEVGQCWEGTIPHGLVTAYGNVIILIVSTNSAFATLSILLTVVPSVSIFTDIKAKTDLLTLAAIKTQATDAISEAELATASGLSSVGGNVDLIKAKTDLLTLAAIKTQAAGALTDFDTATPIAKTSELATITGSGTATLASLETDISEISITGTSAVKVVHPDYYSFDASEKTITLTSPYNTVTVEQVMRIKDLTTNYIIYDCEDSKYDDIPVSIVGGVLTYTAPARDAADTDLLQITVNMV